MKPTQLKSLQEKSKKLAVRLILPAHSGEPYQALVQSSARLSHLVTIKFEPNGAIHAACTCPWGEHGGIACSHVMATLSRMAELKRSALSFWSTPEDARRQKKRTFRLVDGEQDDQIWITTRPSDN
jgi:uncharacterized Zn finger protein